MRRCPKCGGKKFVVTAHVTQLWLVDSNENYIETVNECEEVTHEPDDDDMWVCANKKCNWSGPGRDCHVADSEEEDSAMTEEEYQELKKSAKVLCAFCEASHCDKCQITYLMDDARDEAIDAGLITDC